MPFWNTIVGKGISAVLDPMSALRQAVAPDEDPVQGDVANGGVLDTAQADEDRARQQALIAQLQQQAMFGDPVALQQLQDATQKTLAAESALGQSAAQQQGMGRASALRGIKDGQTHTSQKALGQADALTNLSQMQAQNQLAQLTGQVRGQDINQAQGQQQAAQGLTEANARGTEQRNKQYQGMSSGLVQGAMTGGPALSKAVNRASGGEINGRALVPGDSEANDIVPAMLSPGEIVLPRSVTDGPDAAAQAAAFVRAIKAGRGPKPSMHFAGGGEADFAPKENPNEALLAGSVAAGVPGVVPDPRSLETLKRSFGLGPKSQVPYTPFETSPANAMRGQQQGVSDMLSASAAGQGPSAVNALLQQGTDKNLLRAMTEQAQSDGNLARVGQAGDMATSEQQDMAANAGAARGDEVAKAQMANAALVGQMRGQSQTQAQLQQRAALETTLINMGLDAASRAALINQISGLGQGLAQAGSSGIFSRTPDAGSGQTTYQGGLEGFQDDVANAGDWGDTPSSHTNEAPNPTPGPVDWGNSDTAYAAHGGEIKAPRRMLGEGEKHYELHDGKASFRVAKNGLTPGTMKRISQRFAQGGEAKEEPGMEEPGMLDRVKAWALQEEQGLAPTKPMGMDSSPEALANAAKARQAASERKPIDIRAELLRFAAPAAATPAESAGMLREADAKPKQSTLEKPAEFVQIAGPTSPASPPLPAASPLPDVGGGQRTGGGMPGMADIRAGTAAQQAAVAEQGRLAADASRQMAEHYERQDAALVGAEARRARTEADYQLKMKAQQDQFESMVRKYSDANIDPTRFWANKSTGDKILAGIGLALGGLGAGNTGINQSVGIITQAIDRDIDAQKANLAKQGAALGQQASLIGLTRAQFGDLMQADAAARAIGLERAITQAKRYEAMAAGPEKAAQAAGVVAGLRVELGKTTNQAAMAAKALTLKELELNAKGGAAGDPTTQRALLEKRERAANIEKSLDVLARGIGKSGTWDATGPHNTSLAQQIHSIAVDYAKLKDPGGVARPSEVEDAKKLLFEISPFQRDSTALSSVNSFRSLVRSQMEESGKVHGH